jgi:hypothetical protein
MSFSFQFVPERGRAWMLAQKIIRLLVYWLLAYWTRKGKPRKVGFQGCGIKMRLTIYFGFNPVLEAVRKSLRP